MGKSASEVQAYICSRLDETHPGLSWQTEYQIAGTPIDIAGVNDELLVLLELEWRRADPADNSAKIFRHLVDEPPDVHHVLVAQTFTNYYNLVGGGVSSKRKNAEFVGTIAANSIEYLSYYPFDFPLNPPKRGTDLPNSWTEAAERTIDHLNGRIRSVTD